MLNLIVRRIVATLVTLSLISVVAFILIQLPPGDYVDAYAGKKTQGGIIITQEELDLTYLFIAHDLSAVAYACDRVAVMYLGRLVEMATTQALYYTPKHPYTEALMSAITPDDPELPMQPVFLEGEQPNPARPPSGCTFHPRCRYANTERCIAD